MNECCTRKNITLLMDSIKSWKLFLIKHILYTSSLNTIYSIINWFYFVLKASCPNDIYNIFFGFDFLSCIVLLYWYLVLSANSIIECQMFTKRWWGHHNSAFLKTKYLDKTHGKVDFSIISMSCNTMWKR